MPAPNVQLLLLTGFLCANEILAECWIRSDGVRICTDSMKEEDGEEVYGSVYTMDQWLAVWWFWFAIIFSMCCCTTTGYYYQKRQNSNLYQQGFVTYTEPLILHEQGKNSSYPQAKIV